MAAFDDLRDGLFYKLFRIDRDRYRHLLWLEHRSLKVPTVMGEVQCIVQYSTLFAWKNLDKRQEIYLIHQVD